MSIERDRVSHAMFRSICCCCTNRSGKVHDDEMVVELNMSKNVLLICTELPIANGLVGKLVSNLEDKKLKTINMKMIRPTPDKLMKSNLVKSERSRPPEHVWMIFVWRGDEAQNKIAETVKSFRAQFGLPKNAVYFTDGSELSINEQKLWFSEPPISAPVLTANGDLERERIEKEGVVEVIPTEQHLVQVVENQEDIGRIDINVISSSDNGVAAEMEYSSEGPQPSVNSSQLPSHQSPEVVLHQQPELVNLPDEVHHNPSTDTLPEVVSDRVEPIVQQPQVVVVHAEVP